MYHSFNQRTDVILMKKKKNLRKRSGTESFVTFQIFRTKFSFLHYGPDRTKITHNNEGTPL